MQSARYKPYPYYKDSGVEAFGEIPELWEVRPIRAHFRLGRGRVISHEEIHENPGKYPVYSSQTEGEGVMGFLGSFDFDGAYLTWTTDGAKAGTVFRRDGQFNCTNVCGTLKPSQPDSIDLSFANFALNLATGFFVRHDINPKLMNGVMAGIRFPIPSKKEQRTIAEFLDRETAKIDNLIARKERLIELLEEKRSALITHAVSRGLDPNAPLRNSGIEWLGQIPGQWDVRRLKHIATLESGEAPPTETDQQEGAFPVYGSNGVIGYSPFVNVKSPAILIGRVGASGEVHQTNGNCWVSDNALVVRVSDPGVESDFLAHALRALNLGAQAAKNAQPIITGTFVRSQRIPLPSTSEQRQILAFLKQQASDIDQVFSKIRIAIDHLKEYRAALITAAVTGKIDVSDEIQVAA